MMDGGALADPGDPPSGNICLETQSREAHLDLQGRMTCLQLVSQPWF